MIKCAKIRGKENNPLFAPHKLHNHCFTGSTFLAVVLCTTITALVTTSPYLELKRSTFQLTVRRQDVDGAVPPRSLAGLSWIGLVPQTEH